MFLLIWLGNLMLFSSFKDESSKLCSLKHSAGEITIITPENKTYSNAMSGYYPSTYGFENDEIGSNPYDFNVWEGGGPVNVINSLEEHNKVVEIYDISNLDWAGFYNIFEQGQSTGTIETYVRFSNTNKHHELSIRDGGATDFIYLGFIDGYIRYNDGVSWINTYIAFGVDQWYHVKIEFDCSINEKWYLWIDGNSVDGGLGYNFYGNPTEMDTLFFGTHNTDTDYNYSIDAIGYSWDTNYNIGDNILEGLLIGYENSTQLEWIGYSFDNQNNITILGNKTIPILEDGVHSIQIFGNDSLGTMFQSEKRYFTISSLPLNIVTPENITYNDPMIGYYPATFGFENDELGSTDTDINFIDTIGANGHAEIVEEKEGHKRVLNFSLSADYEAIRNNFYAQTGGVVEYWIYYTNLKVSSIAIRKTPNERLYLDAYQGSLRVFDGAFHDIGTYSINIWYHYAIAWDCSIGNWNLTINGDLIGTFNFEGSPQYLNHIRFDGIKESNFYLDAIGYSWDSTYELGSNLNEGILLSFTNDTSFSHIEYSFDDQEYIEILGNITLPVPEDGQHTIKLFARDNESYIYESDKRYFTIDINPYVKWLSPSEDELVVLPVGAPIFNFLYSYRKIDNATLEINGTDFGSVWNVSSINLSPYTEDIDGYVNTTLYGYEEGNPNPITSDTINITLAKLVSEITELLDYGVEYIGQKLYLILHDPPGDNSFSGYSESTSLSIGINSKFTQSHALGIEVDGTLFGAGVEASANIKATWSTETQYQFQVTDITELVSSQDSSNRDYIGPGYGDRYWGEAITYNWQLKAYYRTYFNDTQRYESPIVYWGLERASEVFLSDYNAPNNWRNLNPVHNNWSNIEWKGDLSIDGGSPWTETHITKTSTKRVDSFQINFDASVSVKIPHLKVSYSLELEWQNQEEYGTEEEFKTSFTIYDDESTDQISFEYGIDELFSTYIFRTYPDSCWTSNPLEYNTFDYVPPLVQFPEIEHDSTQDGLYPCIDDEPIVNVRISDEGGIQAAWINYSIDEGTTWDYISLSEQIANPGTWEGTLPSQGHETSVFWYIVAWDNVGSKTIRKNPHGNPYSYIIINRNPSVSIITPNGGEIFKDELIIQWSAYDPDGDSLTYAVAYNDGGIGWHLIAADLTDISYSWDISDFLYSDSILIKVIAYDDYGGISEDMSDFLFTIEGRKPDGFEFPFFETMSVVSIGIAVFAAAVVLRKWK